MGSGPISIAGKDTRARVETTRLAARRLERLPAPSGPAARRKRALAARLALNPRRRSGRDFSHLARIYD